MKGKTIKFERKIAKLNYSFFHFNKEIDSDECHHGIGRGGWRRACLLTYVPLSHEDHKKPEVLAAIRKRLRVLEAFMKKNYIKGVGCRRAYPGAFACYGCAMPKNVLTKTEAKKIMIASAKEGLI